tara:strand:+ start:979 stop:5649 length:4671 start_codon:yes stop_codon:yes gene_type:complete
MALRLPQNFKDDLQNKDTNLVPIVTIEPPNTGTTPYDEVMPNIIYLSTNDITLDHVHPNVIHPELFTNIPFRPLLLNIPSLKESIDIEKRNYKINSINLDISNLLHNNERFSDIVGGRSLVNYLCSIQWVSPSSKWFSTIFKLMEYSAYDYDSFYEAYWTHGYFERMTFMAYQGVVRRYTHDDEKVKLVVEDRTQATMHINLPGETFDDGDTIKYKPMVFGVVDNSPLVLDKTGGYNKFWIDYKNWTTETNQTSPLDIDKPHEIFGDVLISGLKMFVDDKYLIVPSSIGAIHETYQDLEVVDDQGNLVAGYDLSEGNKLQWELNEEEAYYKSYLTLTDTLLLKNELIQCVSTLKPVIKLYWRIASGGYATQNLHNMRGGGAYSGTAYDWGSEGGTSTDISDVPPELYDNGEIGNLTDGSNIDYKRNYVGLYDAPAYGHSGYAPFFELDIDCKTVPAEYTHVLGLALKRGGESSNIFHVLPQKTDGGQFWYTLINPLCPAPGVDLDIYDWTHEGISIRTNSNDALWKSEWTTQGFTFDDDSFEGDGHLIHFPYRTDNLHDGGSPETSIFQISSDHISSNTSQNTPLLFYGLGRREDSVFMIRGENWTDNLPASTEDDGGSHWTSFQVNLQAVETISSVDISKPLSKKFFADVLGRGHFSEAGALRGATLQGAVSEIVSFELNVPTELNTDEYDIYYEWQYSFAVNKKINSKKLIQELASASPHIPHFDKDGKFKFDTLYPNGGTVLYEILHEDIIDFSFSRTPIEDVFTEIEFWYKKDYGANEFAKRVTRNTGDLEQAGVLTPAYDFNHYGFDSDHSKSTLVVDDNRGSYIRDELTASNFTFWLLSWHINQHLKMKVKLPLKYMNAEIGDIIEFDETLGGIVPYGIRYDKYAPDQRLNGQLIYSKFMITSTNKTLESVEIECIQMHNLATECTLGYDCAGVCGGEATLDACGKCGIGYDTGTENCNEGCKDCAGICNGGTVVDCCGVCGGDAPEECGYDCAGICGGSAESDECDVCGGSTYNVAADGTGLALDNCCSSEDCYTDSPICYENWQTEGQELFGWIQLYCGTPENQCTADGFVTLDDGTILNGAPFWGLYHLGCAGCDFAAGEYFKDDCGVCGGNMVTWIQGEYPDGKCDCEGNEINCCGQCPNIFDGYQWSVNPDYVPATIDECGNCTCDPNYDPELCMFCEGEEHCGEYPDGCYAPDSYGAYSCECGLGLLLCPGHYQPVQCAEYLYDNSGQSPLDFYNACGVPDYLWSPAYPTEMFGSMGLFEMGASQINITVPYSAFVDQPGIPGNILLFAPEVFKLVFTENFPTWFTTYSMLETKIRFRFTQPPAYLPAGATLQLDEYADITDWETSTEGTFDLGHPDADSESVFHNGYFFYCDKSSLEYALIMNDGQYTIPIVLHINYTDEDLLAWYEATEGEFQYYHSKSIDINLTINAVEEESPCAAPIGDVSGSCAGASGGGINPACWNGNDLNAMEACMNMGEDCSMYGYFHCAADIDGDGFVNGADYNILYSLLFYDWTATPFEFYTCMQQPGNTHHDCLCSAGFGQFC